MYNVDRLKDIYLKSTKKLEAMEQGAEIYTEKIMMYGYTDTSIEVLGNYEGKIYALERLIDRTVEQLKIELDISTTKELMLWAKLN